MWIKIILELRTLGYSIPKIKKAKEILLTKMPLPKIFNVNTTEEIIEFIRITLSKGAQSEIPVGIIKPTPEILKFIHDTRISYLEFAIHLMLINRSGIDLILFANGETKLVSELADWNTPEELNYIRRIHTSDYPC